MLRNNHHGPRLNKYDQRNNESATETRSASRKWGQLLWFLVLFTVLIENPAHLIRFRLKSGA